MELVIESLQKTYGKKQALKGISCTLEEGVYGLLGPNGAGKSTLMNSITGTIGFDSGRILFDGQDIFKMGRDFRSILGYMPQQQELYANFTARRFLSYIAALKGLSRQEAKRQIEEVARLVNLQDELKTKLGAYSGGMKQRILIAQAILGSPKVIILDEPTAGLDPKERIRIRNLISKISMEKIVIFATHVVSDIEYIAKEVLLIKNGEFIAQGPPHELAEVLTDKVFEVPVPEREVPEYQKRYRISNMQKQKDRIVLRIISENPPPDCEYKTVSPSLEDRYLYEFEEDVTPDRAETADGTEK